ncbi:hypothetical protein F8M41_025463 [Gigaspora margarita]|uniref:SWIM-type domain-containing protein n=1 Tax=Gigaspora margarita TaxID=4874 RepID=A0A8H4ESX8_GIGMA|nr:hypothetical protein F8M41_025463 [Gigaspora margarita]
MDSSDHKILAQEFSQVAYLAPSPKCNEFANRLLQMNKVLMYEIEKETGKIYVQVESETTPHLIYTTCMYRDPTNICCQCPDFLQKGIMRKHLHAAALYIDNLRQQDQHAHLPEMVFPTYQEVQDIFQKKLEKGTDYKNNDNHTFFLSEEIFNYIKQILGIPTDPKVVMISNTPTLTQPKANLISIASLNTAAIYEQEFRDFLVSTSRILQNEKPNNGGTHPIKVNK